MQKCLFCLASRTDSLLQEVTNRQLAMKNKWSFCCSGKTKSASWHEKSKLKWENYFWISRQLFDYSKVLLLKLLARPNRHWERKKSKKSIPELSSWSTESTMDGLPRNKGNNVCWCPPLSFRLFEIYKLFFFKTGRHWNNEMDLFQVMISPIKRCITC